jgi:hypothetical protein
VTWAKPSGDVAESVAATSVVPRLTEIAESRDDLRAALGRGARELVLPEQHKDLILEQGTAPLVRVSSWADGSRVGAGGLHAQEKANGHARGAQELCDS